jgi:hypothetical protein
MKKTLNIQKIALPAFFFYLVTQSFVNRPGLRKAPIRKLFFMNLVEIPEVLFLPIMSGYFV